jgi:hypothetical protein
VGKGVFPSSFIGHQTLEPSIGHRVGIFLHFLPSL